MASDRFPHSSERPLMSRPANLVRLGCLTLEERITPNYDPTSTVAYIRNQQISSGGQRSVGAIFLSSEYAGPATDRLQRPVDPYFASQAATGLLEYANSTGELSTYLPLVRNYLQWYLFNVTNSGNAATAQIRWYRDSGTEVRTEQTAADDNTAAQFFITAWTYLKYGGDPAIFNLTSNRVAVLGIGQTMLNLQQPDGLTVSRAGSTSRFTANNAEVYAGMLSAARLFSTVYSEQDRSGQYDRAAVRLRIAARNNLYAGGSEGYGWVKDGAAGVTTANPTNAWPTTAVRLFPAMYGVEDPNNARSSAQLNTINSTWAGSKSWVQTVVDTDGNFWPVTGYGSTLISRDTTNGNTHNNYVYSKTFIPDNTRPIQPLTTADAGWMLRTGLPLNTFNRYPVATDLTLSVVQDGSIPVTFAGTDPDAGTTLRYTIVTPPSNGSLTSTDSLTQFTTNAIFNYTPIAGFSGPDSLTFKVSDGQFDSELVTVPINVTATASPPVTPPVTPPVVPPVNPPVVPPVVPPVTPPVTPPVVPPVVVPPASTIPTVGSTAVTSANAANVSVTLVNSAGRIQTQVIGGLGTLGTGAPRAVLADFNLDGTPDYLIGSGVGVTTLVYVANGTSQSTTGTFRTQPFENAFTGGVFVAAGDITGDGVPDIAVSPDQGGGPRVRIFNGATFAQIIDFFGIEDPAFRGGARVSFGDMNNDGVLDLIVAAGFGGGPRITIWDGARLANRSTVQLSNFFAFESALRNGTYVSAGDINGDGRDDLVVGAGPGGGTRVSVFSGSFFPGTPTARIADFFAGNTAARGGVTVAVKDLDGDAVLDIVTGSGPGDTATKSIGKLVSYLGTSILARPNAPTASFNVEPLDGDTSGIYVG